MPENPRIRENRDDITQHFLEFETELGLFDIRSHGVPIWERIRLNTYREILKKCGIIGEPQTGAELGLSSYPRGIYLWIKNLIWKNPLLSDDHDYLFWGHSRRKQLDDGNWCDIYCDPFHVDCNLDYLQVETPHNLQHHTPVQTDNLRYLDAILYTDTFKRKLGIVDSKLKSPAKGQFQQASDELEAKFGVNIDLVGRAKKQVDLHRSRKPLFDRLLSRVDPDVVVVVVGYGDTKQTFIEVCKDANVPVVELQHGIVHKHHLGYSYPDNQRIESFPDYFFSFGEYWNNQAAFPIPDDRIIAVGYPYLEQRFDQYKNDHSSNSVIFISQGTIGEELSRLAAEFANQYTEYDVVYKLHPGEYNRWKSDYPWLTDAHLRIVDSDTPPLYELFSNAEAQVGVYSTAVYEGLYFDLDTYIVDTFGANRMEPLINRKDATLVNSARELAEHLLQSPNDTSIDVNHYFASNSVEHIESNLKEISSTTFGV